MFGLYAEIERLFHIVLNWWQSLSCQMEATKCILTVSCLVKETAEIKSPSPEGLCFLFFYLSFLVVRLFEGARRKRRKCEIPKSVGALHQSANALILTTDLFRPAASACPTPNTALKTRVLREPFCSWIIFISSGTLKGRSGGHWPAWCT